MILKIDHIAFGSADFEADIRRFEALGYQTQFKEIGLKDLENKRALMREFSGDLDMALLAKPGSIGIEVLNHSHVVEESSYVLPILRGAAVQGNPTGDLFSASGQNLVKTKNATEEFFLQESTGEFHCDSVVVETGNVAKAVEFWKALGFKPLTASEETADLQFKPFFGGSMMQMYLRKTAPRSERCKLDSRGFNCLAFFSSDALKDWKKFEQLGMNPTEPNDFRVGGKDLRIFWVRGPEGEVAEVIGLRSA